MTLTPHSVQKYSTGSRLAIHHASPLIQVESWRHNVGRLPELSLTSTEVAVTLMGRARVERTGDGRRQESMAVPGTFWLCPAGVHETDITRSHAMRELVHIFLPPDLLGHTALESFGLDPANIRLDYAGGTFDPLIYQIARAFRDISDGDLIERLMADSLRIALATHLLRTYLERPVVIAQTNQSRQGLSQQRLQRVLDLIEARLDDNLSVDELAREACLSPFHFLRAFAGTVGRTPYQFLVDRRIDRAKMHLRQKKLSLAQVAQVVGFSTQSGFSRAFYKTTGITPGEFRRDG